MGRGYVCVLPAVAGALMSVAFVQGAELPALTTRPGQDWTSVEPIIIFRDPARYVSFPDVKKLRDGRLLCVFRDAAFPDRIRHIEPDARVVGTLSSDSGKSWSKPFVIYDDPHCQNDPSVALLRDGRLLLNFFNWEGRSEAYVAEHKPPHARRVDLGEWGAFAVPGGTLLLAGGPDPRRWEPQARRLCKPGRRLFATSSSTLETHAGTLLLPVYGRVPDRPISQSYVLRSEDGGESWSDPVLIAKDSQGKVPMAEPALGQMFDGRIVALLRQTQGGRSGEADDHLYTTSSMDDGKTWAEPERTAMIGHPADMQVLPDGKLLAVYGYRHEPWGVRACLSEDGIHWDRRQEYVVAAHGAHFDLGYPSVCLTDDGHVLIVYYMNSSEVRGRWIEGKRIPLDRFR